MKFKDIKIGDMVVVGNGFLQADSLLRVTAVTATQFTCTGKRYQKKTGKRVGLVDGSYSARPATPELIKKTKRDIAFRAARRQCAEATEKLHRESLIACKSQYANEKIVADLYKRLCGMGLISVDKVVDLEEF